jgi:hypothetical protein
MLFDTLINLNKVSSRVVLFLENLYNLNYCDKAIRNCFHKTYRSTVPKYQLLPDKRLVVIIADRLGVGHTCVCQFITIRKTYNHKRLV